MSIYSQLIYLQTRPAAHITLNRPDKRNALNAEVIKELKTAFAEADDDPAVRVVVLRGAGKDFCAGADLTQLEQTIGASILENRSDAEQFASLLLQIRHLSKPVIAAVQGRALAGGAGLASACDMVVATRSAQFGYPEVKIGFVAAIVMAILRRNLGEKRAFEVLTTGRSWSAEEAERMGLINRVTDDGDFDNGIEALVAELSNVSASAVTLTKSLLYQIEGMSFEQALRAGIEMNAIARLTPDCQAGIRKFLGKA
jgi:methylglutaconyl-CoA hydratase